MKEYEPNKIRSRPFRFISLPILITFLFIFYWFMLTPLLYVLVLHKFDSDFTLRCTYWILLLIVFLILLIALIFIWRCKRKDRNEAIVNRQAEFSTLLRESKYNFEDKCDLEDNCDLQKFVRYDVGDEEKCDLKEDGFCARESFNCESMRVSLRKSEPNLDEVIKEENKESTANRDLVDEIMKDENFPTNKIHDRKPSVVDMKLKDNLSQPLINDGEKTGKLKNRDKIDNGEKEDNVEKGGKISKVNNSEINERAKNGEKIDKVKIRPKTLHINTSLVETEKQKLKRLSSPLSPREIFFHDLIESANKQRNSAIEQFLENERKNHDGVAECRKSDGSAEFFIMNVGPRLSCTAEAFIFVDEEKSEQVLEIRKDGSDFDDNVFLDN